jgi:uncharacterized membrane protein YtjA (UPF0391 family)
VTQRGVASGGVGGNKLLFYSPLSPFFISLIYPEKSDLYYSFFTISCGAAAVTPQHESRCTCLGSYIKLILFVIILVFST